MWVNCKANSEFNIDIKYCIENDFFKVKSYFDSEKEADKPELVAFFNTDSEFNEFIVGNYNYENGSYILEKKYSISYLRSNKFNIKNFSHFKLYSGNKIITIYPADDNGISFYNDKAILRAKEILERVNTADKRNLAKNLIGYVKKCLEDYKIVYLPFMKKYTWYQIDSKNENFNLSSVKHILSFLKININPLIWYFGVSINDRLFALAFKTGSDKINPFSELDDCTVLYCNEKENEFYFVIGILLLDDGQYFCLPE